MFVRDYVIVETPILRYRRGMNHSRSSSSSALLEFPSKSAPAPIPESLLLHFAGGAGAGLSGVGTFIENGASLVSDEAVAALRSRRDQLRQKIVSLGEMERLSGRIELLAAVFDDACTHGHEHSRATREIAFALLYFLNGVDRIPDSVPEIGYLDDAVVAQLVLQRQGAAVRRAAIRNGWELPAEAA